MMTSTPSPLLSREEELALWRENRKKQEVSRTPRFRDSFSSAGVNSGGGPRSVASRGSAASSANRRRRQSNNSLGSNEEPASRMKYDKRQSIELSRTSSPHVAPTRLSSNVSCRKHRVPRRGRTDLSTTSSRLKEKTLPLKERKSASETLSTKLRRRSFLAERYLSNRPSSLLSSSEKANHQKENASASLVNEIRSRAAMKRAQDYDEYSRPESSTYRTPLTYRGSEASAFEIDHPTCKEDSDLETSTTKKFDFDPDNILDISISLPFDDDMMSPLSITSVVASPASTISSNEMLKNDDRSTTSVSQSKHEANLSLDTLWVGASHGLEQDQTRGKMEALSERSVTFSTVTRGAPPRREQASCPNDTNATASNLETLSSPAVELHADSNSAFHSSRTALDFQGIEDDDFAIDESISDRRMRRPDSSFLLLPRPDPHDGAQTISPDREKSAFAAVGKVDQRRRSSSRFESPLNGRSPSLRTECKSSPLSNATGDGNSSPPPADNLVECDATLHHLSHCVTKVNERAVLEVIPESRQSGCCDVERGAAEASPDDSLTLQFETLSEEAASLRIAKCRLENKLHSLRKAQEMRAAPFRDVFEENRKLRLENQAMRKEKNETDAIVQDLKQQMMLGLQSAVNKTQSLQKEVNALRVEKQELQRQLLEACRGREHDA